MKRPITSLALLTTTLCVHADPENVTPMEIAVLPPYCAAKPWPNQPADPAKANYWHGLLGESWKGLHHYCWALVHVRRAQTPGTAATQRNYFMKVALQDYYYVIANSTPNFVLLPEIWLRIGEAHALVLDPGRAIEAYDQSRRHKVDYWPAYVQGAELLLKVGQKPQAKRWAADGLSVMPDNPQLIELYRKLGGDPATIVPRRPASGPEPSDQPASAPASAPQ